MNIFIKTIHNKSALFFASVIAFVLLLLPITAFAEVVQISPLPTNFGTDTGTLAGYVNTLFYLVIAAAAVLAVLRIIWGGLQYMTSEAVTTTKNARTIIGMAVGGLVLLLASWLLLNYVNPEITSLSAINFNEDLATDFASQDLKQIQEQRDELRKRSSQQKGTLAKGGAGKVVSRGTKELSDEQKQTLIEIGERNCPFGYEITAPTESRAPFIGTKPILTIIFPDLTAYDHKVYCKEI